MRRINGLEPGDYTLREISAPEGFEIAEDMKFTVEATGDIQKVQMKDKHTPITPSSGVPKTGDALPWWAYVALVGACAAGATAIAAGHRLHKRDSEATGGDEG